MHKVNVLIDDDLIERVMKLYNLATKQEAIDFSLQFVAGRDDRLSVLTKKGSGWDGDLQFMRRSRSKAL